jgi:hypothetical protein
VDFHHLHFSIKRELTETVSEITLCHHHNKQTTMHLLLLQLLYTHTNLVTYVPSSSSCSTPRSHPRSMDGSAAAVMQKSGRAATAAAALLHTKEGVFMMAVRRRVVVRVANRINVLLHVLIIIVLLCNGSVQESGLLWQKRQSLWAQIKNVHMSCMWLIRHLVTSAENMRRATARHHELSRAS